MIVIKGMEMPKNCNYCRFSYDRLCHAAMQSFAGRTLEENGRLKDCPLVEIKDELKEKYDVLLKEQEEQIKNRDESLEKAREEIKWLRGMLKEQEAVVRCMYCKRRGTYNCPVYVGGDGMYSEPDDWFCADGERKDS